jgi:hypothetical protein
VSLSDDLPVWDLPIAGFEVIEVRFSGQIYVVAYGAGQGIGRPAPCTQIAFGGLFRLQTPGGAEKKLDAEADWHSLISLLDLRHLRIATARVDRHSNLSVTFDGGWSLTAGPHEMYENWAVTGPEHLNLVAMPGGGDPRIAV